MERFTLTPSDESDLIARSKRGDLDAFNSLILLHQDALFNIALRTLGDEDRAADAVQEALIAAYRSLYTFHGGSFRAWLARTVVNKCYDEYRRSSRHPTLPLTPIVDGEEAEDWDWLRDPGPSPESHLDDSELNDALQSCMKSLPFDARAVLALVDVDGLSYEEAASALRIPVGTVKSRLARARASMRLSLRNFADLLPSEFQAFPAMSLQV
jgi:RNA polymerase sigma-70 factor (ECF subfamily)